MEYNGKNDIQQKSLQSLTDSLMAEKVRQEQLSTVNRYAKGPGHDDESDNENIFSVTDQYGFLHKTEPAALPKQEEEKRRAVEVKRRTKWLKMVRNWDKYVGTERLTKRVYKGIPHVMKADVWRMLLGVNQYMEKMPDIYQKMKTQAHSLSPDIRQIDMDVNRTYRDHIMFKTRYSIKQQQLFHVLAAYSMYNTEVGYCQGMSQIAALLLMYMGEEEAFWALHSLLYGDKHRMHGFFIPGFPKLLRFQIHHDRILKKLMPKLKKHLDENEVFASLYTMKWFFQCFLDRTPFSLTLRLWDIYILEGEKVLTAMSYATLKMHKAYLKSQDMDGIVAFLQEQLVKDFGHPDDTVIEYLKSCMIELKRASLDLPPPPTDVEKPKLPFGSFAPNLDRVALAKHVPQFAKHHAEFTPELKRKGSKKKREKVKRGKSNVTKNKASNGLEPPEGQNNVKVSQSVKEPSASRSPLRRSSRKDSKTERRKEPERRKDDTKDEKVKGDKAKSKTKDKETKDKKKVRVESASSEASPKQETVTDGGVSPVSSTTSNTDRREGHTKTLVVQSNGTSDSSERHEKRLSDFRPGGLHPDTPDTDKNRLSSHKHEVPLSSSETDHKDAAESTSLNNSNNFFTHPDHNLTHSHSPKADNAHSKTFLPPLLAHTHIQTAHDYDSIHDPIPTSARSNCTPSPTKFKPKWNTPHHEMPSTSHAPPPHHGDGSMIRQVDEHRNAKPSQGVKLRNSYKRSQSSDILNSPPCDYTLQKKTPSFTQLSATLDSLENVNQQGAASGRIGSQSSSSANTSPVHHLVVNRPQSVYDNLSPAYQPSAYTVAAPLAIPESSDGMASVSSFEHGLEGTSSVSSGHFSWRDPASQPRRLGGVTRRVEQRRRSMEHTVDADDEMSAPPSDDYHRPSNSKSVDNLREWTARHKRGKKKAPPLLSKYTHNTITSQSMTAFGTDDVARENGVVGRSRDGYQTEKITRSKRMSREEKLTATLHTQMKGSSPHRGKHNSPKRPVRNSANGLDGWEAEGGAMLKGPIAAPRKNIRKNLDVPVLSRPQPSAPQRIATVNGFASSGESDGWVSVEIDAVAKAPHAKPRMSNGNTQHHSLSDIHPSPSQSSLYGGVAADGTPTKGVAYYSRHDLSSRNDRRENGFGDDVISDVIDKSSGIDVKRYNGSMPSPTSPDHWIDITRYSPDHSPPPVQPRTALVLSPSLSNATKADINELLARGINASPNLLFRYAKSPDEHAERNGEDDRTGYYRVADDATAGHKRRQSVNMAVQTEERRIR